jgi:hypothetical protein
MKKITTSILILVCALFATDGNCQIQVSGLADVVFLNSDNDDYTNVTFRRFSNFHTSRTRLFFDGSVSENTDLFVQILNDEYNFQLYGAYARFSNLSGQYLNMNIGYIPSTIGSYAPRTYSDRNPLIGTPLLYNFHSALIPGDLGSTPTVQDLLALRNNRSPSGIPFIYDACWNTGVEFYGSSGNVDYSFGMLTGSVGKPTQQQEKDVPQVTTHIVYNFNPGLKIGASAFYGPYLYEDAFPDYGTPSYNIDPEDYINLGIGYEFYWSGQYLEIYSESYYASWEYPALPKLKSLAGYVEAKYKIKPRWYVAGRFGFVEPSEIEISSGVNEKWDYPIKRYEFGIGYKPLRKATVKLVTQLNRFDINDAHDSDIFAVQFSMPFN